MAIRLGHKQVISFEEPLMSQLVQQEVLTGLLMEKGIFIKEEFFEMTKLVNSKMKSKGK